MPGNNALSLRALDALNFCDAAFKQASLLS